MVQVSFQYTPEQRHSYAAELLRQPDPFKAALSVFGESEIGKVSHVAATWPSDPEILRITEALLKDGKVQDFLPSKESALRRIWDLVQVSKDPEAVVKLIKLMADIQGWIQKDPAATVNVNVRSNVMLVKEKGETTEEWESALRRQQEKLVSADDSPTKH